MDSNSKGIDGAKIGDSILLVTLIAVLLYGTKNLGDVVDTFNP
ncbi:hypothetical protein [Terribacillus saccharophilus]